MRVLVGLVLASSLLAVSAPVEAKAKSSPGKPQRGGATAKHAKSVKSAKSEPGPKTKTRAARISTMRGHERIEPREIARGQSVGEPWAGRLQHPTQLPAGDGYHIRRPARAF